jgi:hypothetical protein
MEYHCILMECFWNITRFNWSIRKIQFVSHDNLCSEPIKTNYFIEIGDVWIIIFEFLGYKLYIYILIYIYINIYIYSWDIIYKIYIFLDWFIPKPHSHTNLFLHPRRHPLAPCFAASAPAGATPDATGPPFRSCSVPRSKSPRKAKVWQRTSWGPAPGLKKLLLLVSRK